MIINVLFVSILSNCTHYIKYTPDPERDIGDWVKNFNCQKSFHYSYKLQTAWLSSTAEGDCIIGLGEHIKGTWQRPESTVNFEYIGLGDIEYIKKDGKWERAVRGEESNIFEQIKRIMEFDSFVYKGFEQGYWYQFKPNIPFLAPKRWRDMKGYLKISEKTFLPEFIWAGLPDSTTFYQISLERYNKIRGIKPPRHNYNLFTVDINIEPRHGLGLINKRLKLIGLNYQLKIQDSVLVLRVPDYYRGTDLESALAPGSLEVWGLTKLKAESKRVIYINEDIKKPVYLTGKLLNNRDIKDARIRFDERHRPYILLKLKKKFKFPEEVVFLSDHRLIAAVKLDTRRKMDKIRLLTEMEYYRIEFLRAGIIQPLPPLKLKIFKKGSS